MVPGLENLLLEHNLGDAILGGPVIEISHRQIGAVFSEIMNRKVSGFIAHRHSSIGTPLRIFRVSKSLLLGCPTGRFVEVFKYNPCNSSIDSAKIRPLLSFEGQFQVNGVIRTYESCWCVRKKKEHIKKDTTDTSVAIMQPQNVNCNLTTILQSLTV